MSYKIVIDSCGELLEEWKKDPHFESVPLTLYVGENQIIDDETFDQADFLKKVAECPECPKSACPSPERYRQAFDCDAEHIYGVTLSAELSGSFNSARTGMHMLLEDNPEKKIYIFNSRSASIGQTLIAMKIRACEESGLSFEETVKTVEKYIDEQNTFFILENLDTLRKNGRLSLVKSMVANALKIKPVMAATPEGNICQIDQARGMNKALTKMLDHIAARATSCETKFVAISHCNCKERAMMMKEAILEKIPYIDAVVLDTAGVSSMYANDGGIIIVA